MDPDLNLIQALQAGDDAALDTLMERHREPLFRFVFRYLQNDAVAQDVVQETFVRCYFKARKYRPKASVKTWLYSIAVNLSRDHLRRVGRNRSVSLDAPPDREGAQAPVVEDTGVLPNDQAVLRDRHRELQRAIDRLPEKLREPLILYSLEGKSQHEVAEILGTTVKTIELRIYHAKTKLRQLLENTLGAASSGR